MVVGPLVPLSEALGRPLPLPWEIVIADVSLGGSVGSWESGRGGGWGIKNTRFRKMENARYRRHSDLVKGEVRRWYMYGEVHGPGVHEL